MKKFLLLFVFLASCSPSFPTERSVIAYWGTPKVISDSTWHIDHYVSSDGTVNDFGIYNKDSTVFFHNNY